MYLNSEEDTNNFKIYVPRTSDDYSSLEDSLEDSKIENIEFDLNIKIWVNNNK